MNESLLGQASLLGKPEPLRQALASWASLGQLFNKDSHLTKAEERCDVVVVVVVVRPSFWALLPPTRA